MSKEDVAMRRFAEYMKGYCAVPEQYHSYDQNTLLAYIDVAMMVCESDEYRNSYNTGYMDCLIDIRDENGWGMQ